MTDRSTHRAHVDRARALFFAEGRDPGRRVDAHIARSWQRCLGVDLALDDPQPLDRPQLRDRREQALQLLECAQPELDGLTEHALGHRCVVILSDASGLILDEIGSIDFLPKAQRVALMPGVEWSEANRGTNAIGTALMEREALMVVGGEHYLPRNGALGCAAAPIFTGRGDVAGVLDISGEAVHVNTHALGLVRMAAQQVEHRMIVAHASGQLLRFHRRPSLLGTAREGLLVVEDGVIVAANRVALGLLGQGWNDLLDRPVQPVLGERSVLLQNKAGLITRPDGQQLVATVEAVAPRGARRWAMATSTAAAESPTPADDSVASSAAPADAVRGAFSTLNAPPDALVGLPADDIAPRLARAVRVIDQGVPVLVTGETGSGKEVFARRLHAASRRRDGPFVAVNCAALPEALIEAELFGYEEGAFTGARRRGMLGRIREADGGVLFLDEIGDMPLPLQTRLLRVLEDRVVSPLGSGRGVAVDFDLLCATHRDLPALAASGNFRTDLLYRVNGFRVALPALRERIDRQVLITRLFGEAGGTEKGLQLEPAALATLAAHDWPGNVRELCSVLRAVAALADAGERITEEHLPDSVRRVASATVSVGESSSVSVEPPRPSERPGVAVPRIAPSAPMPTEPLADLARDTIDRVLAECAGEVAVAAARLGVHRSTIYRHLAQRRAASRSAG